MLLPLLNELRAARGENGPQRKRAVRARPRPPAAGQPARRRCRCTAPERGAASSRLRGAVRDALARWPEDGSAGQRRTSSPTAVDGLLAEDIAAKPRAACCGWPPRVAGALRDGALPATRALRQAFGERRARSSQMLADDGFAALPRRTRRPSRPGSCCTTSPTATAAIRRSDDLRQTFELAAHAAERIRTRARPRQPQRPQPRAAGHRRRRRSRKTCCASRTRSTCTCAPARPTPPSCSRRWKRWAASADTLGMMGLGVARTVVLQQRDAMHEIVVRQAPGRRRRAARRRRRAALRRCLARRPGRAPGPAATAEAPSDDLLPPAKSRKVLDVLVREAIANFGDARQAFVAFVETNWDHAELAEVPRLLDEVAGALRMLELPQPADYLTGVSRYTEVELIAPQARAQRPAAGHAGRRAGQPRVLPRSAARAAARTATTSSTSRARAWKRCATGRCRTNRRHEAPSSPIAANGRAGRATDPHPPPAPASDAGTLRRRGAAAECRWRGAGGRRRPRRAAPVATAPATAPVARGARRRSPTRRSRSPPAASSTATTSTTRSARSSSRNSRKRSSTSASCCPPWRALPEDSERLRPIRRVFHTLKGSGRLVGAKTLGEFSWKIENMLNRVLDGTRPASPAVDRAGRPRLPRAAATARARCAARPCTADLAGMEALAERLAAGEEDVYTRGCRRAPLPPEVRAAKPSVRRSQPAEAPKRRAASPSREAAPGRREEAGDVSLGRSGAAGDPRNRKSPAIWSRSSLARRRAGARPAAGQRWLLRAIHTMNGAFAMTEVTGHHRRHRPARGLRQAALAHAHAERRRACAWWSTPPPRSARPSPRSKSRARSCRASTR